MLFVIAPKRNSIIQIFIKVILSQASLPYVIYSNALCVSGLHNVNILLQMPTFQVTSMRPMTFISRLCLSRTVPFSATPRSRRIRERAAPVNYKYRFYYTAKEEVVDHF